MNTTSWELARQGTTVRMGMCAVMAVLVACGGATTPAEKGSEMAGMRCACDRDTSAKPCGEELWARTQQVAAAFEADSMRIGEFYAAYKARLDTCNGRSGGAGLPGDWNNYKRLMSLPDHGAAGKRGIDAAASEPRQSDGDRMVTMLEEMLARYEQFQGKDASISARVVAEKEKVKAMIADLKGAGTVPSDEQKKELRALRKTFQELQGSTRSSN